MKVKQQHLPCHHSPRIIGRKEESKKRPVIDNHDDKRRRTNEAKKESIKKECAQKICKSIKNVNIMEKLCETMNSFFEEKKKLKNEIVYICHLAY